MKIYRRFLDGIPWYLAKHYWWAYLWPKGVWFFDHQPIINAILFFQYNKLTEATLNRFQTMSKTAVLQLSCVYGSLTPRLNQELGSEALHLTDVANVQLQLARTKCRASRLLITRMNAEYLGYKNDTFQTIIIFFLLHEMPHEARVRTLNECMRVLAPGASLLITEYAPLPSHHLLYRFLPFRRVLTGLEPFLKSFWHEDLDEQLKQSAAIYKKELECVSRQSIFNDFYRVSEYKITTDPSNK